MIMSQNYVAVSRPRAQVRSDQFHLGDEILYWRSLQTCLLVDNMEVLERHIRTVKHCNILGHLKGARSILDMLLMTSESSDGLTKRESCICLHRAYKIYLSHSNIADPALYVRDKNHKRAFKEFLCHPKYGLCIYIYENQIILKPDFVDLDKFFESRHDEDEETTIREPRFDLSENLDGILKSLDSEWAKKVVKVLIGVFCTRKEMQKIGVRDHDIKKMTDDVLSVITKTEELTETAKQDVDKHLEHQISTCNEKLKKLQFRGQ